MTAPSPIVLEPFARADFDRLIAWIPDAAFLMQWGGPLFRWPLDEAQLESYLAGAAGPRPVRAIFRARLTAPHPHGRSGDASATRAADAREIVGHVELNQIDRDNRSATLSRVLIGDPACRGGELGHHMVRAAVDHGFTTLGLHRIDLGVFDFNAAALRCYEGVGFRREGVLRENRRVGDTYWNLVVMSLLEYEWPTAERRDDGFRP